LDDPEPTVTGVCFYGSRSLGACEAHHPNFAPFNGYRSLAGLSWLPATAASAALKPVRE
jgi:hypothetical protein